MQSRVVASGVFFNHSITMRSSSSISAAPAGNPVIAFRFFGLEGAPAAFVGPVVVGSSDALRLFESLETPAAPGDMGLLGPGEIAVGLPARVPASGLPARLGTPCLSFGILGLVARMASTECPPCPAAGMGEPARDSLFTVTWPLVVGAVNGTPLAGLCAGG